MNYYSPKEILERVHETARYKAKTKIPTTLVLAFMAGAYIALGGLLSMVVGGGIPGIEAANPGLQKFIFGSVFPLGLILCVVAGADLFTGNTAYFIPPVMNRKLPIASMFKNWTLVWLGNFAGALFVGYVLTYLTDIFVKDPWLSTLHHIADIKTTAPFYKVFVKGIGANWLVALAVWLAFAAKDITGKILAIWFPVMAFVAMGFEHSIANMFFLPTAWMYGAPISWSDIIINNLIPATLGKIVGGAILTGGLYWYVYDRETKQ